MTDVPQGFYQLILTFCTRDVTFQLQTAQPPVSEKGVKVPALRHILSMYCFYVIVHI